jgi:hypothetical protein
MNVMNGFFGGKKVLDLHRNMGDSRVLKMNVMNAVLGKSLQYLNKSK